MSARVAAHHIDPLAPPPPRAEIAMRRVVHSRGTIHSMRPLTHDTHELVISCLPGSAPLHGRAGQFATLSVPGLSRPRPYSFARDPQAERAGEHTFYVRLVPGGEMSTWLTAADRGGTTVDISGPLGAFTLDDSAAPMLLLAGGSGMSAVKALAEEACRRRQARECLFLYGARTQRDLYALEEMARIAANWHPAHRFEFVPVLSEEPAGSSWNGARGLVTDRLRAACLDHGSMRTSQLRAWLCGPPPMVEAGHTLLREYGVPAAYIARDLFTDLRSPAPVLDDHRCMLCDECLLVRPVAACIVEAAAIDLAPDGRLRSYTPIVPLHTAGLYYHRLAIDDARCIRCYACVQACPHDAISVRE